MQGISKFRSPMTDPVLMEMLAERGLSEVPLFSRDRRNLREAARLLEIWKNAHADVLPINFAPPEDPDGFLRARFRKDSLSITYVDAVTCSMSCELEEVA